MNETDNILIDEKSQQMLKKLVRIRQDTDVKIRLILQTILNKNNLTGNYVLSNDFTTLLLQSPLKEKEKS